MSTTQEDQLGAQLVQLAIAGLRDDKGVRAEDAISLLATIAGERCIEAAGDIDLRSHTLAPGSPMFSDKVNDLLAGDVASAELAEIPSASVFGMLRDELAGSSYDYADFPPLAAVFRFYAAHVGKSGDWGRVPLSVPDEHRPFVLPLRVGYESRAAVDRLLAPLGGDKRRNLVAATKGLAQLLEAVRGAIDPKIGLSIALETVNGMAKTAPMTEAAMKSAASQV